MGRVMRVPYFSLLALLGVYILVTAPFNDTRVPAFARGVVAVASNLPDPTLTPGAVLTTDAAKICTAGFARSVRHTAYALKRAIYAEYHVVPQSGRYEIDHLIPIALGGADVAANLWPHLHDTPSRAGDKDRLENFLHREVCAGRLPLHLAQTEIATDWRAAYRKYLGAD
jgi:hypothetical protein